MVINNNITQISFQNKFFKGLFTKNLMMSNETRPVQKVQMAEVANYYTNIVKAQDLCVTEKKYHLRQILAAFLKGTFG